MVGLSVVLETQNKKQGVFVNRTSTTTSSYYAQNVNKSAIIRPSLSASSFSSGSASSGSSGVDTAVVLGTSSRSFMDICFLCKRRLLANDDIYMYMGEMAFCSEDCRLEHIAVEDVTDADDDEKSETDDGGRSGQISNTSPPGNAIKYSIFSPDYSPPRKRKGSNKSKSRASGGIAC